MIPPCVDPIFVGGSCGGSGPFVLKEKAGDFAGGAPRIAQGTDIFQVGFRNSPLSLDHAKVFKLTTLERLHGKLIRPRGHRQDGRAISVGALLRAEYWPNAIASRLARSFWTRVTSKRAFPVRPHRPGPANHRAGQGIEIAVEAKTESKLMPCLRTDRFQSPFGRGRPQSAKRASQNRFKLHILLGR